VKGYRGAENAARWRNNLDKLLPRPSKVRRVEHFAALPYAQLPELMAKLREQQGPIARALEFTVLTCARLGEALNATAQEVDRANAVWTVPASRMKNGQPHRVPLAQRSLEIAGMVSGGFLFPSRYSTGKPVSDMMLRALLRELAGDGLTIHGFRATFKTWAMERTRFDNHTIESALAHIAGSKLEQAYMRGDVLEKRRQLMDSWAEFCATQPANSAGKVVSMRSAS
jgi:integrase